MKILTLNILALYLVGSRAFGYAGEGSDEDYVAVTDSIEGVASDRVGGKDYFLFGKDAFKRKMSFDDSIQPYYEMYNEDVLALPGTLVFVDDSYKKEFEEATSIDWKKGLPALLRLNYDYFAPRLGYAMEAKRFCHLYLIRGMLEGYEKTGSLTLKIGDPWMSKLKEFKNERKRGKEIYESEFGAILAYIKAAIGKEAS